MAKAKKGAAKGKKSKVAVRLSSIDEPPNSPIDLEHLPAELLDIIFAEAARGYTYAQKLQLCLISKRLRPRGEQVLYKQMDLANAEKRTELRVSGPRSWAKSAQRDDSASRSVSFLEKLLPKLRPAQIQSTKLLSLDLSHPACPPLWALRELRKLFRIFRTSKAQLSLLIARAMLDTDFISLIVFEETNAFGKVLVEIVGSTATSNLSDVVLVEDTNTSRPADPFPWCAVWTQGNALKTCLLRGLGRCITFLAPKATETFSLSQVFSQKAYPHVSRITFRPTSANLLSLLPINDFQYVTSLELDLRDTDNDAAGALTLLRSLVMPRETTRLSISFPPGRPSLGELFVLWHDANWAAQIKTFSWAYWNSDKTLRVSESELALVDADVSWHTDFCRVMEERKATLEIYDGTEIVKVAPSLYQAQGETQDRAAEGNPKRGTDPHAWLDNRRIFPDWTQEERRKVNAGLRCYEQLSAMHKPDRVRVVVYST